MADTEHPQAQVQQVRPRRWSGLLPMMALFLAVYLAAEAWYQQGPRITIHLEQGHSLGEGDPLKFRGVKVGVVESVDLAKDLLSVTVQVRLDSSAEGICRRGSRFWLVHPELGFDRIEGLETLVGAHYLAVDPGSSTGPYRFEFDALSDAPAREAVKLGGVFLKLLAAERGGLAPGARVTYRGEQVGSVLSTRLTSDATGVEVEVHIKKRFQGLVRSNSEFWRTGGFEVNLALLSGLSVELDSLRSLMVGGLAFATPDEPGDQIADGQRFDLHDKSKSGWKEWRPSLSVGEAKDADAEQDSPLLHAILSYESGRLFSTEKSDEGWVVAVPGGVLGPAHLLEQPDQADEGTVELQVEGVVIDLSQAPLWQGMGLIHRAAHVSEAHPLMVSELQTQAEPQDCQIISLATGRALSISSARLQVDDKGWRLDSEIELKAYDSGCLVWGAAVGRYVGILLKQDEEAHVALLPSFE